MYPMVEEELSRQAELDARRAGVRARRLHALEAYAGAKAVPELMRLAELDSRALPIGKLLVAEAAGRIRAAMAIEDESVIADPFVATLELQSLLKLRAEQIRRDRRSARHGGVLSALHLRPTRSA
jgi:hypothetical protein